MLWVRSVLAPNKETNIDLLLLWGKGSNLGLSISLSEAKSSASNNYTLFPLHAHITTAHICP